MSTYSRLAFGIVINKLAAPWSDGVVEEAYEEQNKLEEWWKAQGRSSELTLAIEAIGNEEDRSCEKIAFLAVSSSKITSSWDDPCNFVNLDHLEKFRENSADLLSIMEFQQLSKNNKSPSWAIIWSQ